MDAQEVQGGSYKGHSHNSGEPAPASAAMPTEYVIGIQNLITAEEGRYSYPYRDSTGNATWGIGHKFNSMTDFVAFPWIVAKTGQPATKEEKIAAWNSLMSIHKNDNNYKATSYSGVTGLQLSGGIIDSVFAQDFSNTQHQAAKLFGDAWNKMPDPGKAAVIDMGFNMGVAKLKHPFHHFYKAIRRGDYAAAAAQSHITQISDSRNKYNHDQLIQAAQIAKKEKQQREQAEDQAWEESEKNMNKQRQYQRGSH